MGEQQSLYQELCTRLKELEQKVEALRVSRRVLMNLIEILEKEKGEQIVRLEHQNKRLQKNNSRYARTLICRNARICELERQIRISGAIKTRPESIV